MLLLFFILSKSTPEDIDGCFDKHNNIADLFLCWGGNLKPLNTDLKNNQFMNCLLRVFDASTSLNSSDLENRGKICAKKEKCTTPECEKCISSCESISLPIHQTQCYDGCYIHKRINPYIDYPTLGPEVCQLFYNFYSEIQNKYQPIAENELRISIETMCSASKNALPICYAIAKTTWKVVYENLKKYSDSESFCQSVGFTF